MIGTHKKKAVHLVLVFALIFSLFTPFSANVSKATEIISVAEAIANNSGTTTVKGYIVGATVTGSGGARPRIHIRLHLHLRVSLQILPSLIHLMKPILVKFCPYSYPLVLLEQN